MSGSHLEEEEKWPPFLTMSSENVAFQERRQLRGWSLLRHAMFHLMQNMRVLHHEEYKVVRFWFAVMKWELQRA